MLAGTLLASVGVVPAYAEGTQAGTQIKNVATATYGPPEDETVVNSNEVSLLVDELLDVTVAWADAADVAGEPGQTNRMLTFTITNAGNGTEAFGLAAVDGAGDDMNPAVTSIVLDFNGNGTYDPGTDIVYSAGLSDPELPADGSMKVFVLATIPADAATSNKGRIDLKAVAATGKSLLTRNAGTVVAKAGDGGGDAVFGATGADAEDDGYYVANVDTPPPAASVDFDKEATVADVHGGALRIPGSTITYKLIAAVTGTGRLPNLRISDAIPSGTNYKAGTITLNGAQISDAEDADAGRYTGTGISIGLGDVAAPATHIVTFQVIIDDEN